MPLLNIQIDDHGDKTTVQELRTKLHKLLVNLNGDQEVTFSFRATLSNYTPMKPTTKSIASEEGEIPSGNITGVPTALGAPYHLQPFQTVKKNFELWWRTRGKDLFLAAAQGMPESDSDITGDPKIVMGPLARPEND